MRQQKHQPIAVYDGPGRSRADPAKRTGDEDDPTLEFPIRPGGAR